jgi:hypothetical protein
MSGVGWLVGRGFFINMAVMDVKYSVVVARKMDHSPLWNGLSERKTH